jgi:hypothetical protein
MATSTAKSTHLSPEIHSIDIEKGPDSKTDNTLPPQEGTDTKNSEAGPTVPIKQDGEDGFMTVDRTKVRIDFNRISMVSSMYLMPFRAVEVFVALKINISEDVDIGRTIPDVKIRKRGLRLCQLAIKS